MMEKRINAGKPVDDFIRIQDLWGIFVPKWYWFAIISTSNLLDVNIT